MFPIVPSSGSLNYQLNYQIQKSLRFRSSASAYLSRVFNTPTDLNKWTMSMWVKRGTLNNTDQILAHAYDGTSSSYLYLQANNTLTFMGYNNTGGSVYWILNTQMVFRDPSAWYHLTIVYDSNNATSNNRAKLYINGVEVTAFQSPTYPSLGWASVWNKSTIVGRFGTYLASTSYFDGYLAEVNFVDGQALSPSSFGQTDPATGQWTAKKYTGAYGNNGFYLPFTDTSSTSNLVKDAAGSNHWTPNNISLTAGATYDSVTDVPFSYGTGDRGNFCTFNPLDNHAYTDLKCGNTQVFGNTATNSGVSIGTMPASIPAYWETTITTAGGISYAGAGIASPRSVPDAENYGINSVAVSGMLVRHGGGALNSGYGGYGAASFTSPSFTTGDVIGVAVDPVNGAMYVHKNGTWMNSGVPTSGASRTGATHTWTAGAITVYPAGGGYNGSVNDTNFGQRPFAYTPPSGFKALHTGNLPEPTIVKPNKHFDVNLRTGTSAVFSVTGKGFAPDLVWTKSRANAHSHLLFDKARGVQMYLSTNTTTAETTDANTLTSFNSDGYSGGNQATQFNVGGAAYVDWLWKAGGAAVSNTAGSITSQVSANPTAGFSVVTFTAQPSGSATIGHGLGVAPKLTMFKSRGVVANWHSYHAAVGAGNDIFLNLTNGSSASANIWAGTAPTSSVVTIGTDFATSGNWVAYCFAEIAGYSKIGSYVGNGSTDGPFVYCGFRPRFILVKNSSVTYDWYMYDSSREGYNAANSELNPNSSAAEVTGGGGRPFDMLSNGFKIRNSNQGHNGSGNTMIFIAIAEAPFQYSLAR